jgi:hypothetical protein
MVFEQNLPDLGRGTKHRQQTFMAVPGAVMQWWNIQVTPKIIIKTPSPAQETDHRIAPPLTKCNSLD